MPLTGQKRVDLAPGGGDLNESTSQAGVNNKSFIWPRKATKAGRKPRPEAVAC